MAEVPRVVGIDLSITSTGLADSSGRVARVHSQGHIHDPLATKVARHRDIAVTLEQQLARIPMDSDRAPEVDA